MPTTPPDLPFTAGRLRTVVTALARRLRPAARADAKEGDVLTPSKLSAIGHLYRAGTLTPSDLAKREGVRLATLTRLLAELESDGWINRRADPADARRSILRLTHDGEQRLLEASRVAALPLAHAIETFTAAERQVLSEACALLERLDHQLGEPVTGTSPHSQQEETVSDSPDRFAHRSMAGTSFHDVNLQQAVFDDVNLQRASFTNVSLIGTTFENVNMSLVQISNVNLDGMTINGVQVSALFDAWKARGG